jgi:carboxypeptidase family protein
MRKVFTLAFALLLSANLWAQGGSTGAISGVVQDPSGAVIANALVLVVNRDTGVTERQMAATGAGTFSVTLLPPGNYEVVVTAPGFKKFEARNVAVRVSETAEVTARMQIGEATESVTVEATAPPVQLSNPAMGETITAHTVDHLPLSNRNFFALLSLSSGTGTEFFDSTALGRGQVTLNVNGQRPTNNNYQLEGINANDYNLPILDNVALPNPDTIGEFKTQTSLYDASQGRNGGGNVQVDLKHGTNQYHGDGYEFFRDRSLNANDFFLSRSGQKKPQLHQNEFGGSFGGPIPKVKDAFFFGNYQGWRESSGLAAGTQFSTQIPVLPADRSAASLQAAFFPNGLPAGSTGLDPVALAYLNLPASKCPGFNDGTHCLPSLPGSPGLTSSGSINLATIIRSSLGRFSDDQFTITGDKAVGSKDKFTGSFYFSNNIRIEPFGNSSSLPFSEFIPGSNRFAKFGWTRALSTNSVNEFRAGFNRFQFNRTPTEPITLADIGATRGNSGQFPSAYQVIVPGIFSLGTGVNDNRGGAFNTFEYADDYSLTMGRHTLRIGGSVNRYQLNRFNNFATRGSVTFGSTPAGAGGIGIPALNGFQNFLLGRITTTQAESGITNFFFRATDYSLYLQDDWKRSSRLTLNLGIRWEGLSTAHERRDFLSNFQGLGDNNPGPISIIHPAGTPGVGTPGVSRCTLRDCLTTHNFGPRVGFAYDLFGDQKTVVRGGYGIYYDRISNQSLLQTAGGLPFSEVFSAASFSVSPENPFPGLLPASAFPLPFDQVVPKLTAFNGSSGAPIFQSASGGPLSGFFFFPVRSLHAPYTQEWNLTVQHEVWKGWVAEVGYVGTHGVSLLGPGRPFNPGKVCTTTSPCVIPTSIGSGVEVPAGTPFVTQNPDGSISITGNTAANIDARVPARFLGLANSRGFFQENQGFSWYNSLQASLKHQWSNGLYLQAAYTWSRSLDNGTGSQFGDELNGLTQFGDLLNPRSNYGLSDFDRTHRLVVSYNYDLPFAKLFGAGTGSIKSKLINGWSVNGVTVLQSGTPFIVIDSSAATLQDAGFVNLTNFATLAPGATFGSVSTRGGVERRLDNYIDLSKFIPGGLCVDNQNNVVPSLSPACTGFAAVGNAGRNHFRGPFQQNWDFSIQKTTKIREYRGHEVSLDLRAEFFNIFNHPSFESPQAAGGSFGNYGIVDVASGSSAILSTVNRPRVIQFASYIRF